MVNWHWSVFVSFGIAALGMHIFFAAKLLRRDRYDHVLSVEIILILIMFALFMLALVGGTVCLVMWLCGWL